MKLSDLLGAGGRVSSEKPADFSTYTELGSDGIGYIATVQSSPEEAAATTAKLPHATDRDWADFIGD